MNGSTPAATFFMNTLKQIADEEDPVVYTQMSTPSGDTVTFRIELVDISKTDKPRLKLVKPTPNTH
jgi:hypothetical protein